MTYAQISAVGAPDTGFEDTADQYMTDEQQAAEWARLQGKEVEELDGYEADAFAEVGAGQY